MQDYPGRLVRLIYVDDGSVDGTALGVARYAARHGMVRQLLLLSSTAHAGPGHSRFLAYHRAFDDEIVAMLDGDDWLFSPAALSRTDAHYRDNDLLASYGGYVVYRSNALPKRMGSAYGGPTLCLAQYPPRLLRSRAFTHKPWNACHLRSAYARLFKSIQVREGAAAAR